MTHSNFGISISECQSVNSTPTLTIYNYIYSGHHGNLPLAHHYWKQAKVSFSMPTIPPACRVFHAVAVAIKMPPGAIYYDQSLSCELINVAKTDL